MEELLLALCRAEGVAGHENAAAAVAAKLLARYCENVRVDALGSVVGERPGCGPRLLLDAHLDQIGMAVTAAEAGGFLRVAPCGGMDIRVLAGQEVTIHGKETLYGVIPATPPHLSKADDKPPEWKDILIDAGLPLEALEALAPPGTRVTLRTPPARLLGQRFTAPALDDRAGVAAILRCLELLEGEETRPLTILFSAQEETFGQAGAKTAGFAAGAESAVVIDVSFAQAPGLDPQDAQGKLGGGAMIGISPALDEEMGEALRRLAGEQGIPHTFEVMGGRTGTNADALHAVAAGIPCALLSIPLRNMHTAAEIVDMRDVEAVAKLTAAYILNEKSEMRMRK
ncbi:MAG: M20/M25/M40 family metallo-hydrolase [Oscillospiraceae bacterium]|jgi:endoglucanase|nr:M20/M25/M40 family metallo-hydrolase [Oscillospiraceae bacterium]